MSLAGAETTLPFIYFATESDSLPTGELEKKGQGKDEPVFSVSDYLEPQHVQSLNLGNPWVVFSDFTYARSVLIINLEFI